MAFAEKFHLFVGPNLLNMQTKTFIMPADHKTLLKTKRIGSLKKFVLSLDTVCSEDNCINQSLIDVREVTLMSHLQDSIVERVNVFTLSLRKFSKSKPCCPEVADWFAKFFKSL